jgi:orotate phosphoribosyltransferase
MTNEETLDILRETDALLEGHFELRSGLHSGQFFQCANALMHPEAAEKLCSAVVAKYKELSDDSDNIEAVISPALGGIIVGHEVARALGVPSIFAEKKEDQLVL